MVAEPKLQTPLAKTVGRPHLHLLAGFFTNLLALRNTDPSKSEMYIYYGKLNFHGYAKNEAFTVVVPADFALNSPLLAVD
jgi:hypothetical protein